MEFFVIVTINKFKLPHVGPKQISLDVLGAWFPRPANENFPRAAFSDKRGDLRFEFVVGDRGRLTFLKERSRSSDESSGQYRRRSLLRPKKTSLRPLLQTGYHQRSLSVLSLSRSRALYALTQ